MAHRIYRLAITPDRAPEVRRVIDFDGRSSLWDVHRMIQTAFALGWDHLYAFYLSGTYFDSETEFSEDSRDRSVNTLLFRLGLRPGKRFVYLFDFGDELRHTINVVSVTDVEVPLKEPVVVESVGEAPPQYGDGTDEDETDEDETDEDETDEDETDEDETDEQSDNEMPRGVPERVSAIPPELVALERLSERVLALDQNLESRERQPESAPAEPGTGTEPETATLIELAQAALELGRELDGDVQRLATLEEWLSEGELVPLLLDLPARLSMAGETEQALAVARAFTFVAPDQFRGEIALTLARAGRNEEATAQVALNLTTVENASIAEGKAGDVYLALGEPASAEAYYQRALVEATTPSDRALAATRLAGFFLDLGREREAQVVLEQLKRGSKAPAAVHKGRSAVGRNEPCPCGSGKKYKKCHGSSA